LLNGSNNLLSGGSFGDNFEQSFWSGMASGAIMGGISGGIVGYNNALKAGKNVWWGGKNNEGGFGMKGAAQSSLTESQVNKIRASEIYAKETSEQDNNYNFFYKRKDIGLRFSAEHIDDGGAGGNTIVINAHGAPDHIEAPTASGIMKPQQLHEYLLANNKLYHESYTMGTMITVRLEACSTGSGFAQIFSGFNEHMIVVAPNHNIQNVLLIWNYVVSEGESKGQYLEFWRGK